MFGAILGDIVGSSYPSHCSKIESTDTPLFSKKSHFTGNTVMTLAAAKGLIEGYGHPEKSEREIIRAVKELKEQYPDLCGSLSSAIMCVSPAAWIYNNLRDVDHYAEIIAHAAHMPQEDISSAKAIAATIFLARQDADKDYIRQYIGDVYNYDLSHNCNEVAPAAITAFLNTDSFESAVRLAVSSGEHNSALTAVTAAIAGAFYGIPDKLQWEGIKHLEIDLRLLWNYYVAFVEDLGRERLKQWDEVMQYMPFFQKDTKTTWIYSKDKKSKLHKHSVYPSYGMEIGSLERVCHRSAFTDYRYKDTLARFGVKGKLEIFKSRIPTACPLLLRAMLAYLIREERFHEGLLAEAVESDVVAEILEKLDGLKISWLCDSTGIMDTEMIELNTDDYEM